MVVRMPYILATAFASLISWAASSAIGKDSFGSQVFLLLVWSASFHFSRRFLIGLRPD